MPISSKYRFNLALIVLWAGASTVPLPAAAADPHQHGVGKLLAALDGSILTMEFTLPGHDAVGFEHAPKTKAQKSRYHKALEILRQPAVLFHLNGEAGCKSTSVRVLQELLPDHGDDHDHDDHDDDDHDHDRSKTKSHGASSHKQGKKQDDHHAKHDHDDHDDDDHDHDHDAHKQDAHKQDTGHDNGHGEFRIRYEFQCRKATALRHLDLRAFDHFKNLTKVNFRFVGPRGQRAATLTRPKNTADF